MDLEYEFTCHSIIISIWIWRWLILFRHCFSALYLKEVLVSILLVFIESFPRNIHIILFIYLSWSIFDKIIVGSFGEEIRVSLISSLDNLRASHKNINGDHVPSLYYRMRGVEELTLGSNWITSMATDDHAKRPTKTPI